MKIKIIVCLSIYIVLSVFTSATIACPDPDQGDECDYWWDCGDWCCDCVDGYCEENYYVDWCSEEYGYGYCYECIDCGCVLKDWAECGQHSDCTGECHGGCYTCTCLDDSSKCNAANCEECNNGICEDRCVPLGEYCDGAGESLAAALSRLLYLEWLLLRVGVRQRKLLWW